MALHCFFFFVGPTIGYIGNHDDKIRDRHNGHIKRVVTFVVSKPKSVITDYSFMDFKFNLTFYTSFIRPNKNKLN